MLKDFLNECQKIVFEVGEKKIDENRKTYFCFLKLSNGKSLRYVYDTDMPLHDFLTDYDIVNLSETVCMFLVRNQLHDDLSLEDFNFWQQNNSELFCQGIKLVEAIIKQTIRSRNELR